MTMFAMVSRHQIDLPPGAVVRLPATWQDYQTLRQQRGDGAIPRIKYRDGEVVLMSPLPQHGRDAHLLAHIIITLLDYTGQEYDAFTPVTMDLPEESGIEPDYCFYIDHWAAVSGKKRIDWRNDPPPDLVLEIDVTSYSNVNDYLPYQVPECWFFQEGNLRIYGWQDGEYLPQEQSRYFPEYNLQSMVVRCLGIAYDRNTSAAIRELRTFLAS
jgi:Uma2 family endonuclease